MYRAVATVLLIMILAGCSTSGTRPLPAATPLLKSDGLQSDVDILERAYTNLHPGLLRYNSAEEMHRKFQSMRATLAHDQTRASAYLAFSQFAAQIKCGHTYANFYNQSDSVQAELFKNNDRVPFYFKWLDGRMIVTRNFSSDPRLVAGSEVLSINGVAASDLLHRLMSIARADGSNDAKRMAYLQAQGDDKYEAFDIFAPLLFPAITAQQRLRVREPNGAVRQTTVAALTYDQRLSYRAESMANGPPWQLTFPRDDVALLTMPTWAMYNSKWDWHSYLKRKFDDLVKKRVRTLIVDLRANEGGDDVGNEILAHFIDSDMALPNYRRLIRYRSVPTDLAPYLDTWDPSFKDWGDKAEPLDQRFYRLTRYDDDASGTIISPIAPRFRGKLLVLVGPTNSSATFQFAEMVKSSRMGMLIGSPTGATAGVSMAARSFSSGCRIPASKWTCRCSEPSPLNRNLTRAWLPTNTCSPLLPTSRKTGMPCLRERCNRRKLRVSLRFNQPQLGLRALLG